MRKTTFNENEFNELKKLISRKVLADKSEQKKIRNNIRNIGFHFSDFSSKKGYNVSDLENLVRLGKIKIKDGNAVIEESQPTAKKTSTVSMSSKTNNIKAQLLTTSFLDFIELNEELLKKTGLYCIRLKANIKLPNRYQNILDQRSHRIIYIGKAQGQSLKDRLNQEVFHTSPGTFFRSIGAVLNYTPIPGHLKDKKNQKNYKFSLEDTLLITKWLLKNTEFGIQIVEGDFTIENEFIKKYCPLLNDKNNPLRLAELREDRKKCREIAVGKV